MSRMMYYRKYKNEGRCGNCGRPLEEERKGKTLCVKCNEIRTIEAKKNYDFLRSIGVCPRCGKEKLEGEETICLECAAKNYAASRKYRANHPEIAQRNNDRGRERYHYRKEHHLCVRCGEPVEEGFASCEKCRMKNRQIVARCLKRKAWNIA